MKLLYLKLRDKYSGNYLFLGLVLFIYFLIWLFNFSYFKLIWLDFLKIFIYQILPVLIIIFSLIFIFNILIEKDYIKEKLKNSTSFSKYIFSIIWWTLSTWPVYMWYPFLKQLKNNWLNYWHIASFMYARAIKIPFFGNYDILFLIKIYYYI